MHFGKYQGVVLTDVPRPYLRWLRRQGWLGAWLARAIDEVLERPQAMADETMEHGAREQLRSNRIDAAGAAAGCIIDTDQEHATQRGERDQLREFEQAEGEGW
jgi:hypothetical protein